MGSTTVLLYEYKPFVIVISLVTLMLFIVCWMGVFFYYDKTSLLVMFILCICVIVCSSAYWIPIYWLIAVTVSLLITGLMTAVFVILFFMNNKINGRIANRIFLEN